MNDLDIGKPPAGTRVVVAMSGGVDSSTVAALLKERGYDVVGVTLQLYDYSRAGERAGESPRALSNAPLPGRAGESPRASNNAPLPGRAGESPRALNNAPLPGLPGGKTCCAGRDILDARRVADALDIPHYVLDYESRFRAEVMEPFADAYLAGETPIPCVACNRTVKFRDLLATARDLGADALATGHYVRRVDGAGGPELHAGADSARDQSYFLFATTQAQLALLRFPLGCMSKDETRALAARLEVPVAAKPDSQDICFVPGGNYARAVERLRPGGAAAGEIADLSGRVLGRHSGVINFTVGQRRGLDLGNAGRGEPLYVVRIEAETARVVVGPRAALLRDSLTVRDVNWLDAPPDDPMAVSVKVRSTSAAVAATVRALPGGRAEVVFAAPQGAVAPGGAGRQNQRPGATSAAGSFVVGAVAPGQACVFYGGSRVLGGGWIERAAETASARANRRANARLSA